MTDRERRRLLKRAFRETERCGELASSPLSVSDLRVLLGAVSCLVFDTRGRNLCDHTYRFTRRLLRGHAMGGVNEVISFLRSKGFFCDCALALNLGSWLEGNKASLETRH
jgi:Protein of unknown function (DUF2695)